MQSLSRSNSGSSLDDLVTPAKLKQIGDKAQQLVCKAEQLYQQTLQQTGTVIGQKPVAMLEEQYKVFGMNEGIIGYCSCPYQGRSCGGGRKNYQIFNCDNKSDFWISELQIHLIREHGEYSDSRWGSKWSPEKVYKSLGLQAGADYSTGLRLCKTWEKCAQTTLTQDEKTLLSRKSSLTVSIDSDVTAYLSLFNFSECPGDTASDKDNGDELPYRYLHLTSENGAIRACTLQIGEATLQLKDMKFDNNVCVVFFMQKVWRTDLAPSDALEWV